MEPDQYIVNLVRRIVAFNDTWHMMRDQLEYENNTSSLESSEALKKILKDTENLLRDQKAQLQVSLLRISQGYAYLRLLSDDELKMEGFEEPLFSVTLTKKFCGRSDACHIPVRVIENLLSEDEIKLFIKL